MGIDVERARHIIEPILGSLGLELIDVRFVVDQGRPVFRILIDKTGGVTVGDCQKVTREIETVLEVEGVISGRYFLEVSSPGLDRPLVREADFFRFMGQMATVKTREPIEGRRNYKGLLKAVEEGQIIMEIDRKEHRIPMGLIEKAHLVYEGGK